MQKGEYLRRDAGLSRIERHPDLAARRIRAENQRRQQAARQLRSTWGGYARVMA